MRGRLPGKALRGYSLLVTAAELCPKEFVAEKLPKLRILKAVGIQRAMVGPYVQFEDATLFTLI